MSYLDELDKNVTGNCDFFGRRIFKSILEIAKSKTLCELDRKQFTKILTCAICSKDSYDAFVNDVKTVYVKNVIKACIKNHIESELNTYTHIILQINNNFEFLEKLHYIISRILSIDNNNTISENTVKILLEKITREHSDFDNNYC